MIDTPHYHFYLVFFYSKLLLLNIIEKKLMSNEDFLVIKLEKHSTKDIIDDHVNGSLTVIWRDWDKIIPFEPKNGVRKLCFFQVK